MFMKKLKSRVNRKTVLPDINKIIIVTSLKDLTSFDYIFNIANNSVIDNLTFIQLAGAAGNYNLLNSLIEKNKITRVDFFMSDYILKMSKGTLDSVKKIANKTGGSVKIYTTHVKFTLIKSEDNYYVINSTANAASNSKIEFMEIHNNKEYYDYLITFVNKHFV